MRRIDARVVAGLLLIGFGLLFLGQSLGWIAAVGAGLVWTAIFGGAGLAFLYVFLNDRRQWWALFPAMSLLGLGLVILLDTVAPPVEDAIGGFVFLGMIAAAFWLVVAVRRDYWWAIIPAGALSSVAIVALVDNLLPGAETAALLFLGISLTFLLLTILPADRGRQPWAVIPGGILLALAVLIGVGFGAAGRFFWPLVLIVGGIYLLVRGRRPGPAA